MIKAKITNKIREDDPSWKSKFKIIDRVVEVKLPHDLLNEVEKDLVKEKAIQLIGSQDVDVSNLKAGDVLKVFYGQSFKLIGEIEIL